MDKRKISVLTWVAIVLTIIGMILAIYMNIIIATKGYLEFDNPFIIPGLLICFFGFILGIGGFIAETSKIYNKGMVICFSCILLNLFCAYCSPYEREQSKQARRISCATNIKQIYLALKQYAADYSGHFPPANGAVGLEYLRKCDYLTDYSVYICPTGLTERGRNNQPLTEQTVDYVYIGGLTEKSDPNTLILYDKPGNNKFFGNIGFIDGTVKEIYGKDWMGKIKK